MRRNNAKEHVKLYKSKKNWVAATIFTTALGITGVSAVNNVSANSVSSSSSSVNSASSSQVSSSSVKPSSTVTLRSSSAANSSSSSLSSTSNNFAVTNSSSTQADSNSQKKASLQSQISQKQNQLKQQESQQSQVQNQYNQDQQALQNQKTNQANQNLQNQINQKQSDLQSVNNQLNDAKSSLTNAQTQYKLANTVSGYNDNEGVVENVAHMNHDSMDYQRMFGPLYVSPDNNKGAVDENDPLMLTLDGGFTPGLSKHDLINNNHPTQAQYKEVCEALMAEINATREARGLQPFVMTDQMFNEAMERASQPTAQGENKYHDMNGISKAFEDNGIDFKDFRSEALAEYANLIDPMKDVADLIYSDSYLDLYEMLDDDASSNWIHRGILLGDYDNQPVQASFGLQWVPEDGDYNLVFDVANYNGNGSDNLMNQIKDWENQPATIHEDTPQQLRNDIETAASNITKANNQISNLQKQKQDLQDQISDLQNQLGQTNNDQNKALYDKTVSEKNKLDDLNNQIAQTKQEINNLESQLNALNNQPVASKPTTTTPSVNTPVVSKPATTTPSVNTPVASKPATTKPSVNTPVASKPATTKPSVNTPVASKPATTKPSVNTPVASKPATTKPSVNTSVASKPATTVESPVVSTTVETKPSVNNDKKTDDVLPGPDQIVVTPEKSSVTNDKSSSSVAKKVVASISYNKGIDPLTNQLLSDETPAQRQKAKSYVESLNKTVAVKEENKISEPVYNQPITFTFSENKVKADNVKGGSEVKNELPTTGENQDKAATVLGIEAVSMGLALGGLSFLKRKKKH